jgi:hypothetical protein
MLDNNKRAQTDASATSHPVIFKRSFIIPAPPCHAGMISGLSLAPMIMWFASPRHAHRHRPLPLQSCHLEFINASQSRVRVGGNGFNCRKIVMKTKRTISKVLALA